MAKAKALKKIRDHKTSPGGRNHTHNKKAHEDTIGVPKWGAAWKPVFRAPSGKSFENPRKMRAESE
jgi:hypothetical protein